MKPFKIYIGWDPRETIAYQVAAESIIRRASVEIDVEPLKLENLKDKLTRPIERKDGKMWCPISQAPMATEFAISRFCVPLLWDKAHHPWALFVDCDILCTDDIAKLFALADSDYAVMVVKHQQAVKDGEIKMDNQPQTAYSRKNWSSVVLWNCLHEANQQLTWEKLNTWPGRDLHAFKWLQDKEIGELPAEWNYLVDVSRRGLEAPKIYHYTLGGPWFADWKGGSFDGLWKKEAALLPLSAA